MNATKPQNETRKTNSEKTLISVIIPVYNVKDFLADCLNSVIMQTYRNLEIILIDDGSTDISAELCLSLAEKDSRIVILSQKNRGLAAARNIGIEYASGEYITFIDSDDFVSLYFIECLFHNIHDSDIAMCNRWKKSEDGVFPEHKKDEAIINPVYAQEYSNLEFLNLIYKNPKYIAAWGKLYKTGLLKQFRFHEGIIFEDEDLLPRLIYHAEKIVYIDQKLYFYRTRDNSIMTARFSKKNLNIIEVCERRIQLFDQWGLPELKKTAVKDYYLHLIHLYKRTKTAGLTDEHRMVKERLKNWRSYGIRLTPIEFIGSLR